MRRDRPKLVVVGNACLDVIYHLDRLPKPGETLIARQVVTDLGGKGLNQAIAASRAGAEVHLIAPIGTDATAKKIRAAVPAEGMADHGLITHDGASDDSLLLVEPGGENFIISNTRLAQSLAPAEVEAALTDALDGTDLLVLQGNLTEETTLHCMEVARQAGVKLAVNPSPFQAWFRAMPIPDLVIANQLEAKALSEGETRAEMTVVTLGQKGCRLHSGNAAEIIVPAPKIQAVASGGAGDVFAGTFIAEWLRSGDPEGAARLAVLAASDKATRHGTLSAFPASSAIETFRQDILRDHP